MALSAFDRKGRLLRIPYRRFISDQFPPIHRQPSHGEISASKDDDCDELVEDRSHLSERVDSGDRVALSLLHSSCDDDDRHSHGHTFLLSKVIAAEEGFMEDPKKLKGPNIPSKYVPRDKMGIIVDQPVTFHRKIKSSGYGLVPNDSFCRMKLRKENMMKKQQILEKKERDSRKMRSGEDELSSKKVRDIIKQKGPLVGSHIMKYPLDCSHPTEFEYSMSFHTDPSHKTKDNKMPIYQIVFHPSGSSIAMRSTEKSLSSIRLSSSRKFEGKSRT